MQKILKTPAVSRAAVAWAFKIACACAHTSIQDFAATIKYKGSNLPKLHIFSRRERRYSGSCLILFNLLSWSSWGDAFCYCLKAYVKYFICFVFSAPFSIAKTGLCIDKNSFHTWSTGFSPLRTSGSMGGRNTCKTSSPSLSQMLDQKTRKKLREGERKSVRCVCNHRPTYICVCVTVSANTDMKTTEQSYLVQYTWHYPYFLFPNPRNQARNRHRLHRRLHLVPLHSPASNNAFNQNANFDGLKQRSYYWTRWGKWKYNV